jgi:hypothetical protein
LIKSCGSGAFNRSSTGNASKSESSFLICALCAAEIRIAPGAIAADCPKGLFVLKRGTEKSPDCFMVTPLTAA